MSSASLPAGGGNADLPPDERLKGDVKLALLQNLKTQLLTDAARTHKLLTEKKEALARQLNPFVPSGDRASSKPRKVVVCVCVPEQVEQVVTFSTELDGAIPIFFHSYHPARKFMSREQPWFKTQPFQLLVYAPLQFEDLHMYSIFMQLQDWAATQKQPLVLRILATRNEVAAYRMQESVNHDLLQSVLSALRTGDRTSVEYFEKGASGFDDRQLAADLAVAATLGGGK
eukprot:INCI540.2.p1 GENE.INCI540.2~~INCI540.2.p1  ORF type:complete len:229 (+),score=43.95 INCI540.2:176-862(+)